MKILIFISLIIYSAAMYSDEDFYFAQSDDRKLNEAFRDAKATLEYFLQQAANRGEKFSTYAAYVKIEDEGEVEYMWVADVKPYKDFYIGVLVSEPRLVTKFDYGDTLGFEKTDIYDWQLKNKADGKVNGAYTICAMSDDKYLNDEGFKCDS